MMICIKIPRNVVIQSYHRVGYCSFWANRRKFYEEAHEDGAWQEQEGFSDEERSPSAERSAFRDERRYPSLTVYGVLRTAPGVQGSLREPFW